MPIQKFKLRPLIQQGFTQHKELNPQLFDENKQLRPIVREKLLEIADDFIGSLGVDHIDFDDIVITGSLANYNWNPYSDIDLHVIYDFKEIDSDQDLVYEFFQAKKGVWNESHDVTIYGYDVEIYGQDTAEQHLSTGIYSLVKNEWLVEPKPEPYIVDQDSLIRKTKYFIHLINDVLSRDEEDETTIRLLKKIKEKIKRYRQSGLEDDGEYSEENLVFKLLRRTGYLDKLSQTKHKIEDKMMSLPENAK